MSKNVDSAISLKHVGTAMHTGNPDFKKWYIHSDLLVNYLTILLRKKFAAMGKCFDEEDWEYTIKAIAYGHDILKNIKRIPSSMYDGKLYYGKRSDVSDTNSELIITISEMRSDMTEICKGININSDMVNKICDELISTNRYHGINSGLWIFENYNVDHKSEFSVSDNWDPNVIIPILMHTCPIPSIYDNVSNEMQILIDCTILADKLASNYYKAVMGYPVPRFLHQTLFGIDGTEFNYSITLYIAKLISQGKDPLPIHKETTKRYKKKCEEIGVFVPDKTKLKVLGENKVYKLEHIRKVMEEIYEKDSDYRGGIKGTSNTEAT